MEEAVPIRHRGRRKRFLDNLAGLAFIVIVVVVAGALLATAGYVVYAEVALGGWHPCYELPTCK